MTSLPTSPATAPTASQLKPTRQTHVLGMARTCLRVEQSFAWIRALWPDDFLCFIGERIAVSLVRAAIGRADALRIAAISAVMQLGASSPMAWYFHRATTLG